MVPLADVHLLALLKGLTSDSDILLDHWEGLGLQDHRASLNLAKCLPLAICAIDR
jgi:hypothetical protein